MRLVSIALVLAQALAICPAPAAVAAEPETQAAPAAVEGSLSTARELIADGDYDRAIEILKAAITDARTNPTRLRDAYLLLIKTYVYLHNYYESRPQGREASHLNLQAARVVIAECLSIKELRHTRPEEGPEYPPEMIRAFEEVRAEVFGSLRVVELEPRNAIVLLGADTLRTAPGDSLVGDTDIAVGQHLVVIRAPRFKDMTEEISISANSVLEKSFRLSKRRSRTWYTTVAAGALAVVGGSIALLARGSKGTSVEPLPGPPPPPAN